ncbi:MAG: hypothetical protein ACLFU9_05130 [Candidatus Bathyarchaeia archaeon]
MKDECSLCGRVLYLYSLKRCPRCKKLYCRSCMTIDLWSEQRDYICLNCARRIVAPRRADSKYSPLREYLWRRGQFTSLVTLTFPKIEGIIKSDLPFGALRSEKWWNNNKTTSQGYAWTSVGWKVQNVNLKERTVTLKRQPKAAKSQKLVKKRRKTKKTKPFIPVPVKPLRVRKPSKTRIAKALARAKNVERRKTATPYKTRFKPKSAYEKRMYKSAAKPQSQS